MTTPLPKLSKLGKLEIGEEASFGTGAGSFQYLRCDPVDRASLTQEALEDNHQRTKLEQVARIPGVKSGNFTIKGPLHGYLGTLPSAAPAGLPAHPLAKLLDSLFGYSVAGGYVVTDTTGSLPITLKGADLASFVAGQAIANLTNNYGYQVDWLTEMDVMGSPNMASRLQSAAQAPYPVETAKLHGSISFGAHPYGYWNNFDPGNLEAFGFKLTSLTETLEARGCRPSNLKITVERGKPAQFEMPIQVASWTESATVTPPVDDSWDYPPEEAIESGWVAWGSDAASPLPLGKLEFDLGLELAPVPDLTKPGGVGNWYVKGRKPKATFTVLRSIGGEVTDWAAQTGKPFVISFGSRPGKMFSICFPCARIVEYPAPGDEDGRMVSKITIEAQAYSADQGAGNLCNTDVRFAII